MKSLGLSQKDAQSNSLDSYGKIAIKTACACLCWTAGIFGQPLEDTLKYELERDPNRQVPEIVQMCVEFLYANGLEVEGIFRFVLNMHMW